MLPVLDLIATVGGLIVPPAFDFIKKKFIKSETDTPEATASSLAATKPEVLPGYVTAVAQLRESEVKVFNRDVIGAASQWVVDLRAAIRPAGVVGALVILGALAILAIMGKNPGPGGAEIVAGIRLSCETVVSSWFGDRIRITKG